MNLNKIKKAYFIGIKGMGMIALAQILQARGIEVLGSDNGDDFSEALIKKLKIKIFRKFDKKNILSNLDSDIFISSVAYYNLKKAPPKAGPPRAENNPEIKEIIKKNLFIFTYAQVLGMLFQEKYGIAVAGTHGKSTTTAMLGIVLEAAGLDPTAVVGTRVLQWGSNARTGKSKYLVAEADEYCDNFLNYQPKILVLTNVEYDHPDFFKNFQDYKKSFIKIIKKIPKNGLIIASKNKNLDNLLKRAKSKIIRYNILNNKLKLKLKTPGEHNQFNAGAVMALGLELGINKNIIIKALENFAGISRRFELKGEKNKVIFIDDYAHHPSEIQATLQGAREIYPKNKIWVVFQPHTFSRTKAFLNDFAKSFDKADEIIILDIYGSAREKKGNINSKNLVKLIKSKARYISNIKSAAKVLKKECKPGDIVLAMGAGDIWRLSTEMGI